MMSNDWTRAALNSLLAALNLALVALLWDRPRSLCLLLIVVGISFYYVKPSRASFVVYSVGFLFGPLAEAIVIWRGAWEYAFSTILGFPLWLPFVWGNSALFLKNTAELSHILFPKPRVSKKL